MLFGGRFVSVFEEFIKAIKINKKCAKISTMGFGAFLFVLIYVQERSEVVGIISVNFEQQTKSSDDEDQSDEFSHFRSPTLVFLVLAIV